MSSEHLASTSARTFSVSDRPRVVVVGGQHGNEPAGCKAARKLIDDLDVGRTVLKKGTLVVFACVNKEGLSRNSRSDGKEAECRRSCKFVPTEECGDSNRYFRKTGVCGDLQKRIAREIQRADFVVDMHEGYSFHRHDHASVGASVMPHRTGGSRRIAEKVVRKIDETIDEPSKKFTLLDDDLIEGSIRSYSSRLGIAGILVETAGQNNLQPLDVRSQQHRIALDVVLDAMGTGELDGIKIERYYSGSSSVSKTYTSSSTSAEKSFDTGSNTATLCAASGDGVERTCEPIDIKSSGSSIFVSQSDDNVSGADVGDFPWWFYVVIGSIALVLIFIVAFQLRRRISSSSKAGLPGAR